MYFTLLYIILFTIGMVSKIKSVRKNRNFIALPALLQLFDRLREYRPRPENVNNSPAARRGSRVEDSHCSRSHRVCDRSHARWGAADPPPGCRCKDAGCGPTARCHATRRGDYGPVPPTPTTLGGFESLVAEKCT